MISRNPLLQNESSFDLLFCEVVTQEAFSIYYNSHFSEDPIFNHVFFSDSYLEDTNYSTSKTRIQFEDIVERTERLDVPASLYLERIWKNSNVLGEDAIDFGFMLIEQMHVLKKNLAPTTLPSDSKIEVSGTKDIAAWNQAFVRSFGIPDSWIPELKNRLSSIVNDRRSYLLVALEEGQDYASGCSLLVIEPSAYMGAYCVGTIPERRSHGVARSLMAGAEQLALQNKCDTILLQTLASDGVAPMYFKMGYETAFERDVFQVRA